MEKCARDGYALLRQGLHTIVRIAQQETDNKHALLAGQWLVQYGEELYREKAAKAATESMRVLAPPSDRETILNELKGLYAKALGSSNLIVEAEPETTETERS